MPAFRPLSALGETGSGVQLIIDSTQEEDVTACAQSYGGTFRVWQRAADEGRASIATMVYGHRMLWVKKLFPNAAFLHVYFDPDDPFAHAAILKDRFGDEVVLEMKFVRSPWLLAALGFPVDKTLPAAVIALRDERGPYNIDAIMEFCRTVGIPFQNPHTSVIEDNGLFAGQIPQLVDLKSRFDPYNLLNPGKLRSATTKGLS